MLLEHFNLRVQPFGVTPDPRFLYLSKTHREAIASLHYGIRFGRGFTALIAPPGMGKTTLLFSLLGLLKENERTAFLFQTLCGPDEFLRTLLADLGISEHGRDKASMHATLNSYLLQESKNARQVIVVIDEAQNLDDGVLELVRMLSNFETPGKKLMQIVLSGQPQLADKLASERLTQLRQRISIVTRLNPFNADETREYIEHRLRVAGAASDKPLFSKQAYAAIARQSGGIPRNINNLCFNSISLACALGRREVDSSMVQEAINDLDLTTIARSKNDVVQNRPRFSVFKSAAVRFTSWRYAAALAVGILLSSGPFVHRRPVNGPILQEHATNPWRTSGSDSAQGLASNDFAKQVEREQPQQPQRKSQPGGGLTTSASNTLVTNSAGSPREPNLQENANHTFVETGILSTHDNKIHPEVDTLALAPGSPNWERLQQSWIVSLPLDAQVREKMRAVAEESIVPLESATQREKP